MSRRPLRGVVAVLCGVALSAISILPPAHAHAPDARLHPGVVHRHAALHLPFRSPHPAVNASESFTSVENGYRGQGTVRLGVPIVADGAVGFETPSFVSGDLVVEWSGPLTHGPPGSPSVPRAPPLTARL